MTVVKGNFGDDTQQPSIDFSKTTEIKCEICLNDTFEQSLMLRKLSALVSPTNQETVVPVQVFDCKKCGHVNSEFRQSVLDI